MTEAEYPAPRVEESGTPCLAVAQLPALPVRILVLGGSAEARPLAPRLEQLAADLGAGTGVDVSSGALESWHVPLEGVDSDRHDVVVLQPASVPPASLDPETAPAWLVERVAAVLAEVGTRVWLMAPPNEVDAADAARRRDLARRVVRSGGPPAVVVPEAWVDLDVPGFVEACVERLLHDDPLGSAVHRASAERVPSALLLLPDGRRHGLDLARLLEDHRARIGDRTSSFRVFQREYEAFRSGAGDHPAFDALGERLQGRGEALGQVKDAIEEINRDRDPAGWTRLAANIARVAELESEEEDDRTALRSTAASVADQGG